jgi:hypothetical protein
MVIEGYELEEIEASLTDAELAGLESLAGDWAPWYTIPGAFLLALARATARLRDRLGCTLDHAQELMAAHPRGAPYTSVRQNIRDWCERGDRMTSIQDSS